MQVYLQRLSNPFLHGEELECIRVLQGSRSCLTASDPQYINGYIEHYIERYIAPYITRHHRDKIYPRFRPPHTEDLRLRRSEVLDISQHITTTQQT